MVLLIVVVRIRYDCNCLLVLAYKIMVVDATHVVQVALMVKVMVPTLVYMTLKWLIFRLNLIMMLNL